MWTQRTHPELLAFSSCFFLKGVPGVSNQDPHSRRMLGLCKELPASQRSLVTNPEELEWLLLWCQSVLWSSRLPAGSQTWVPLCSCNFDEETLTSKDYCLTLNLLGRESALSVFRRTPPPKKNPAELFIRWVPPAMIKGKMRTNWDAEFGRLHNHWDLHRL